MNGINGLNMMWFLPISGTLLYISHGLMIVSINPKVGVAGMVLYFSSGSFNGLVVMMSQHPTRAHVQG